MKKNRDEIYNFIVNSFRDINKKNFQYILHNG